MDAFIRNKCEHEILLIIKEVSDVLDIKISVEAEPYEEGSLKNKYFLKIKNHWLTPMVLSVITPLLVHYLTEDAEQKELSKQLTELQIHEARLNIKVLEQQLNESNRNQNTINADSVVAALDRNLKITRHKSNFYKTLESYPKITKLEISRINSENQPIGKPLAILREDFGNYIIESDKLPPIVDAEADIEIVSPVLKRGIFKWKGIYKGETIDFFMNHEEFKEDVFRKGISFKNGSRISCVLETRRKLSEFGEIQVTSFAVTEVHIAYDGVTTIETSKGRENRNKKEAEKRQLALFSAH
ncbi:hypothetical protein CA264_19805 [Pontibacter actiniarum]|uniref:Uncharacterized protein n=2 Tax=Pontibacter actiniarum TaxID=323450 RepID=A0A1X9YX95_9BACT|nr:hypothetical protein CA264_19805 [Pontibacter actiniarum]